MSTKLDTLRNTPPAPPKDVGRNVRRLEGWRQRLLNHIDPQMTYRQIADRTGGGGSKRLSHTTVRSALVGDTAGIQLDTLAYICDAVGVDMQVIIGGADNVRTLPPKGGQMKTSPDVIVLPIIPLDRAHEWQTHVSQGANYEGNDLFFADASLGDGVMAARVTDSTMAPEFEIGDVVLFAPRDLAVGANVVVEVMALGHSVLRRWKPAKDGTAVKLEANDKDATKTISVGRMRILGAVIKVVKEVA